MVIAATLHTRWLRASDTPPAGRRSSARWALRLGRACRWDPPLFPWRERHQQRTLWSFVPIPLRKGPGSLQPPYARGARTPSPRNRGRAILRVGRGCLGSALHWWPRLFRGFPVCNPEPGSVSGPITGDPDPRILPAIAWFPLVTLTCD